MSHAVHFRDSSGEPRLEDAASLDAALARLEGLRNDEGASEIRVFREIPIEVRTYYKVVAVEDAAPDADGERATDADVERVSEVDREPAVVQQTPPSSEPPSGAMVMSWPPVSSASSAPADGTVEPLPEPVADQRRPRFSRS